MCALIDKEESMKSFDIIYDMITDGVLIITDMEGPFERVLGEIEGSTSTSSCRLICLDLRKDKVTNNKWR